MRELSAQATPLPGQITHAALLRRDRWRAAWRRTNKRAMYSLPDENGSDLQEADIQHLDEVLRCRRRPGRLPFGESLQTWLRFAACFEVGDEPVWPEVIESVRPDGRRVHLHPLPARFVQRLFVDTLNPVAEGLLLDGVFAYRPKRGVEAALYVARGLARAGLHWAVQIDLARFFDSVRLEQIERSLLQPQLRLHESLVRVGVSFPAAHVLSEAGWRPMPGTLLQGSVAAPILSNLVAHEVLDVPLARLGSQTTSFPIRYGDDCLLLSKSRAGAAEMRDALARLVANAGWEISVAKSSPEPLDLDEVCISFLGKELCSKFVTTPQQKIEAHIERVVENEGVERWSAVNSLVVLLAIDPLHVVFDVRTRLQRRDRELGELFDAARTNLAYGRKRRLANAERLLGKIKNRLAVGGGLPGR